MATKKTFTPDQIPGLKQAAEAMSGRVYTHPYDDGTQGQFIYKDDQLVPFSGKDIVYIDEEYLDQESGSYGTHKVAYSTGQSVIDQAMADPLSWVASNANWAGLGHNGDFTALDEQMKFLKDNKYDLSTLPNQGGVNQYNLTKQILAQGTTDKWKGEGYGKPIENAKVIAGMLANTGIKDIKDFGKFNGVVSRADQLVRPKDPADLSKGYVYDELQNVDYFDQNEYINKSEARPTGRTLDLPEGIPVRQESSFDNEGNPTTTAIASIPKYGETFGNKATKQSFVDSQNYNQARGNIFSGTYIGKDSTHFGVQFAPDGTPYFYTQEGDKTSSMGDIMPMVSLGLAIFAPGIGGAIGSALTGTAATTVLSKVVGAAIVQGTMAELSGGNFKDGAISGAVGAGVAPLVSNTIGSAVAEAMGDSAFSKVVNNAVNSAATAGLTAGLTGKGDVLDSALNAAVASVGNTYGRELGGDTGAKIGTALGKIATGADAEQVLTSTIMDTLKSTVKDALKDEKNKNDLSKASSKEVGQGEVDAIKQYLDSTGTPPPSMAEVTTPGADTLQNLLDSSSGTQLASSDNDAALSAIEDLRKPAEAKEDPLLGLSSAEVGQGEIDAITGVGAISDDTVEGGVSTDTTGADTTGADTTGADTTGANDVLNGLLSGNGVTNEDDLLGGLGDDTLEGGVSTDTTGADSVAGGAEDPLLGLSSAEVGQGEIDAITGAGATGDDSTEGGVSTDTTGAGTGTETAPVSTGPMGPKTEDQTRREKDEFGKYLDYMRDGEPAAPTYGVQDLDVTDENFKSFDENLKKMLDDGNLPTQWKPGANGTSTLTSDDGSTLTIDADGEILGSTDAPKGNLISDTVTDPVVTKPVTTTGEGTTNTTTTNTTTKAADTSSGVDILSLLALMGGEQKPVQQKQEVNDDPFVEFDFNSPFRVNPFAPRSPTPRMAEGGSIDELLELLQYRG